MKICCLSLVLLLAADHVTAQAPAINAACNPAGQAAGAATLCASSSFCDANTKVCSLLPTATTCDASNPCVTGSSCSSGTCSACVTADGYEAESTACKLTATGKVGSACTTDGDCTGTTPNTVCGTSTVAKLCSCASDYVTKTSDNTCEKIAIGGACTTATASACIDTTTCDSNICKIIIGGACTSTTASSCIATTTCDTATSSCRIKVDDSCSGNTDKCVPGATCDTNNVCKCDTAVSTENTGTKTCTPKAGFYGAPCTADADCTADNTKCTSNFCVCDDNKTFQPASLKCSGGAAVSLSVVMLVMATLVSLLTTRH